MQENGFGVVGGGMWRMIVDVQTGRVPFEGLECCLIREEVLYCPLERRGFVHRICKDSLFYDNTGIRVIGMISINEVALIWFPRLVSALPYVVYILTTYPVFFGQNAYT